MAFKYVKRTSKKAKARKGESYVAKIAEERLKNIQVNASLF